MNFSKEEVVAFNEVFKGFEDGLVMSKLFEKYTLDNVSAERQGNTIWRPQPYIVTSNTNGQDQTGQFQNGNTQLSVPMTLGYQYSVPLEFTADELRDLLQRERLGDAAMQRLASDVNVACSNLAALTGTVWVKRTPAATGYDDIAEMDDAFNRVGIPMATRYGAVVSGDYNKMAGNLAQRVLDNGHSVDALRKAYLGPIAGFETYKLDYGYRLPVAAGVGVTINGANQRYSPIAWTIDANTGKHNVDNRFQTIAITVTSGTVKVGDAFRIAGVNEVHHITKQDTGQPKTFRIAAIVTGAGGTGTVQISPPIIAVDGGSPTQAMRQYQNVSATPAAGAAVTFLNTATAPVNPFWHADAFEIMPGEYKPDPNAGMPVMSATTDQGIKVTMAKQASVDTLKTKYRWDIWIGLLNKQPQMTGGMQFNQP